MCLCFIRLLCDVGCVSVKDLCWRGRGLQYNTTGPSFTILSPTYKILTCNINTQQTYTTDHR